MKLFDYEPAIRCYFFLSSNFLSIFWEYNNKYWSVWHRHPGLAIHMNGLCIMVKP